MDNLLFKGHMVDSRSFYDIILTMKNRDKKRLLIELDGNYIVGGQVQIDFIEPFVKEYNDDLFVLYQDGYLNREIFQTGPSVEIHPILERPLSPSGREFLERHWYSTLKKHLLSRIHRNGLAAGAVVLTVVIFPGTGF